MKKHIFYLAAALLVANIHESKAQQEDKKLKFVFAFGLSKPTYSVHHNLAFQSEPNSDASGLNFSFGLESVLKNRWSLRSELGYVSTDSYLGVRFLNQNGSTFETINISDHTHNAKMYVAFIPCYKVIKDKPIDYSIYGGFYIANDVSFTLGKTSILNSTSNIKWGLSLGNELSLKLKTVSLNFRFTYLTFQESKIMYSYWPGVQYHYWMTSFGVGYGL